MSYEIKMPQLGMNQDSAVIVTWLKELGEQIEKGEPIFEVETDKATMEVESQFDGYLAGIFVNEGIEVPVGQVVATLVESEKDLDGFEKPTFDQDKSEGLDNLKSDLNDNDQKIETEPLVEKAEISHTKTEPIEVFTPSDAAKVLASPKAKYAARELGIDLLDLKKSGIAEPIHFTDLKHVSAISGSSSIYATVGSEEVDRLLVSLDASRRLALFSKFTMGAWQYVFENNDLTIRTTSTEVDGMSSSSHEEEDSKDNATLITISDLCDTRLTAYVSTGNDLLISFAKSRGEFIICLSFNDNKMRFNAAAKFLNEVAARIEDPIRQLI